jgi:hypothetical protein
LRVHLPRKALPLPGRAPQSFAKNGRIGAVSSALLERGAKFGNWVALRTGFEPKSIIFDGQSLAKFLISFPSSDQRLVISVCGVILANTLKSRAQEGRPELPAHPNRIRTKEHHLPGEYRAEMCRSSPIRPKAGGNIQVVPSKRTNVGSCAAHIGALPIAALATSESRKPGHSSARPMFCSDAKWARNNIPVHASLT